MSEAIATKQPKAGIGWLDITRRILVGMLMFLAMVGFIVDVAGLVGVWVVRGPAYNDVTDVTATLTHVLGTVDNGLTRMNTQVQDAQQAITRVNNEAAQLGDNIQANSPLVDRLSQRVNTDLGPRIENVRSTASTIHDAIVSFNSALVAINRFPGVSTPRLNDVLASVSQHAQDAQAAAQDLRATLAGMKGGVVSKAEAAVRQVTARISAALRQVQTLINKYQTKVTDTQTRVTSTSNTILTMMNVLAVALTILFIIYAMGLVLLVFFCWQYVRNGRFPSLRIAITP